MVDVEALALAYLRNLPALAVITFGTQRPVDLLARVPFVLIARIGGAATVASWRGGPTLDRAGIDVQGWAAPDRAAARALVCQVVDALTAARSTALHGGVIVRVGVLAGPSGLPDPATGEHVHRYAASVQVTIR